ncbi:molybdopterin-guanine dinucleotide biosynthesis protein B [Tepidibacillus fermentans]|uniref:Molybdopterin guanine dinucleotide biosynthesis accessory protein MobB n=1 Tax=Tepidibacillus fermentans TaxID=1281767 RepID=A0A4R3K971_9BACI|nr:molybdopterin-guanine dinucleotide biosynthesis protein B [Tepidibacillus fermentans]TCS79566.1 molybdopterin guanine dinucleotide biosynthesis accessory protein MobB [Tepidibacillus fermentans]
MLNKQIPIISFVGFSGSGKTTLLTKIIAAFKEKGYRVATVKHDAHRFQMDVQGKDTWKYAQAGSDIVLINSQEKLAMIENLAKPISFEEVVSHIENVDIIFVEGYKHESPPKVLLVRRETDLELLPQLKDVIAIATSLPLQLEEVPVYDINDFNGIVHFIETKILGEKKHGSRK